MFSSKAVAKLLEDEDLTSVMVGSLVKSLDLPEVFQEEIANELATDTNRSTQDVEISDELDCNPKAKKPRGYQPREYIERVPRESSSWYRRYLAADKRNSIQIGESQIDSTPADKKIAAQFKTTFRVYWSVFEEVRDLIVNRKFHDPTKKDAVGFSHDIELLILGLLYYVGWDTTFGFIATNTEIDPEVHRTFHHKICAAFKSIKDEFIYLPRNKEEYDNVTDQYESYGFPGCVGSIDVVHIAWGNCPHAWLPLFKGKERYTSIGFQVSVTARRFIQHVSESMVKQFSACVFTNVCNMH